MSWQITNNSPGASSYTVSDAEYAVIDFGNGVEDVIHFETEDERTVFIYLQEIDVITAFGPGSPAPGVYPGYHVHVHGIGGSTDYHVDSTTKDDILALLMGPGSEDTRIEFVTLEGVTIHLYTKNMRLLSFVEDELLIPEPD
jgi:hypothetical protein